MSTHIQKTYFVAKGEKYGTFLIGIENELDKINVLELPKATKASILCSAFDKALDDGVLEFVEKLPDDVFEACKTQYCALLKSDISK